MLGILKMPLTPDAPIPAYFPAAANPTANTIAIVTMPTASHVAAAAAYRSRYPTSIALLLPLLCTRL